MFPSFKHQHLPVIEIRHGDCCSIHRPYSSQLVTNHSVSESAGILPFNEPYRDTRALPENINAMGFTQGHRRSFWVRKNSIHSRIEMHEVIASIPIQQLHCVFLSASRWQIWSKIKRHRLVMRQRPRGHLCLTQNTTSRPTWGYFCISWCTSTSSQYSFHVIIQSFPKEISVRLAYALVWKRPSVRLCCRISRRTHLGLTQNTNSLPKGRFVCSSWSTWTH